MGERIALDTPDGPIGGWLGQPEGAAHAGIVVIQEIFGVNAHIRDVVQRFAGYGYAAIAPALFDPVQRDVELGYDAAGIAKGRELVGALGFDRAVAGVDAAARRLVAQLRGTDALQQRTPHVFAIGYCWGGSVAFLANTRLGLPAVSYYGARTIPFVAERSRAPLMFHFGAQDASIPPADIATIQAAHPDAEVHVWPAKHGFNCDRRADYDADSAQKALAATLGFIERHIS